MKRNQGQSAMVSTAGSQQRTPTSRKKKRKCASVNLIRLFLGLLAITFVIVITGVQESGWEAIADVLFGGITWGEVIRYSVIVALSMVVGYWMKRPKKVYIKVDEQQQNSEAEAKAEE